MANDLTTPLTGRKRKPGGQRPHLPVARTLFAVLALIAVAFVLRLVLTDDRKRVLVEASRQLIADPYREGPR